MLAAGVDILITVIGFLISFILLTVLVLPAGHLVLSRIRPSWKTEATIIPYLVASTATGLVITLPVWWIISLIAFNPITVLGVPAFFLALVIHSELPALRVPGWKDRIHQVVSRTNAIFIMLHMISLIYIGAIILYAGWATPGDPWVHSTFVTLIVQNGRIPTSLLPLLNEPIHYPVAFHLLPAALWVLGGILPGEGLLLVAGFAISLIPVLVAWWTYSRTESYLACVLAYLFSHFYSSLGVEYSLWGYFFNGTYAILVAVLIPMVCLIILEATLRDTGRLDLRTVFLLFLLAFGAWVTYPVFVVVPALIIALGVIQQLIHRARTGTRFLLGRPSQGSVFFILASGALLALGLLLLLTTDYFYYFTSAFISSGEGSQISHLRSNYYASPIYFLDPMAILLHGGLLISTIVGLQKSRGSIFLWTLAIIQAVFYLSEVPLFHDMILFIVQPQRFLVLVAALAFVFAPGAIMKVAEATGNGSRRQIRIPVWKNGRTRVDSRKAAVVFISIVLILPSLVPHASFYFARKSSGFQVSSEWADDQQGILWLKENANGDDLILNSQTYSDFYFPSFGVLNVVYARPCNETVGVILFQIWTDPTNETLVRTLLEHHSIDYVYVSSYWAMIDVVHHIYTSEWKPNIHGESRLSVNSES